MLETLEVEMSKCPECGQDHQLAIKCIAAKGGRAGKGKTVDSEKMRKAAMVRWEKYRKAKV